MRLYFQRSKHYRERITLKCVAEYGNNKHRDILVYDRSPMVRENVARWGTPKHRNILKDDVADNVRLIASLFS